MKGSLRIIEFKELEGSVGVMEKSILEIGNLIKCMGKVNLSGLMGEFMKANTTSVLNMAKESSSGPTAEDTKELGKTEKNTAKVLSSQTKENPN